METCFTVILPFAIDPNPPQRRKRLENADISGKRILVVEDNELNMEIAEYILKEAGASVEKAENGKVALEQYQISEEGYYDAILRDLRMPVRMAMKAGKTDSVHRIGRCQNDSDCSHECECLYGRGKKMSCSWYE